MDLKSRLKSISKILKVRKKMESGILTTVPDGIIPKMLFLAIDTTTRNKHETGLSDEIPNPDKYENRLHQKFKNCLDQKTIQHARRELQLVLAKLSNLIISPESQSTLESIYDEDQDQLSKEEEATLCFTEIFETYQRQSVLDERIKTNFGKIITSKKIPVSQDSGTKKKTFFVFAENKVFMKICDKLTAADVVAMYQTLRTHKEDEKSECHSLSEDPFEVDINQEDLESISGLKDVAFYYLVLSLMQQNVMNRLYTHLMVDLIHKLMEATAIEEQKNRYCQMINSLNRYPISSRPPGICIIFNVTKGRSEGAMQDALKVKELFAKTFKYDVILKSDPTLKTIKTITDKMSAPRNKFYDSLVVFFMGHGSKTHLKDAEDNLIHRRKHLIEPFINLEWFQNKPKLFFIQACAVKSRKRLDSTNANLAGLKVSEDAVTLQMGTRASSEWTENYGKYLELSMANNYADTLVSYATMWYQNAALSKKGSVYIDTLVDVLRENGLKESIENVLRKVHYKVNMVCLWNSEDQLWKQTPYFESSLQKEFVFTNGKTE